MGIALEFLFVRAVCPAGQVRLAARRSIPADFSPCFGREGK